MRNLNLYTFFLLTILFSSVAFGQKNSFKNITIKDGLPQSDILDAVQDSIGYIWFATQGGGIAKYDGKKFKIYNQNNGLLSNYSNALLINKNQLFVGTDNGLSVLNKEVFTNYKSPKINTISVLNGSIFLGTEEGVYAFKNDYVIPIKLNLKIDLSKIISITYQNSYYWIETAQNLWKLKTLSNPKTINKASKKERFTYLSKARNLLNKYQKLDKFKSSKLSKAFIDNTQTTWLLSKGNGVYQSIKSNFKHLNLINTKKIGKIVSIHKTIDAIWFSDSNSIFKKDSTNYYLIDTQDYQFQTTAISSDQNNNLWIGSKNKGIYIFRRIKDSTLNNNYYKIERLHHNNGLPSNQITSIKIEENVIWLSTRKNGIVKLEYDFDNEFVKNIRVFNKNNGIKDVDFTTTLLHEDKLWYGTKNGALGFIKNNTITHFSNTTVQKTAISSLAIKNNKLLIGTLGQGLYYLENEKINQLKPYNNNFLTSLNVYQILVDHSNNVWVGSEKGLDRLVFEKNLIQDVKHYNANDGFLGIETSLNTSIEANNSLWFGTTNGISEYTSSINKNSKNNPTLFFEDITIDNILLENYKSVIISDVLQLKPLQNNISFSYKSIDLNHPDRINYQWKLNDQHSKWTKENKVNFANLKSGHYTLSIKAKNSENLISESKIFQFYIDKPLYSKTWFLGVSAFILLLVILTITTSYTNSLNKKNKEEVAKLRLENHLINLEQKALQLQMNPHFIFNVLNSIKALGNKKDTEELNNTINIFASLLRAILHNSRKEEISLSEEINTLKNYIDLENKMTSVPFNYSVENNIATFYLEEILIPPMLFQPFIENSIKHGFSGLEKVGCITIEFSNKNNQLICKIKDNGIGLSKKKSNSNTHKSVALKLTKERIKSISKYSSLEISEIIKEGQIQGTIVIIRIPLKTDF